MIAFSNLLASTVKVHNPEVDYGYVKMETGFTNKCLLKSNMSVFTEQVKLLFARVD